MTIVSNAKENTAAATTVVTTATNMTGMTLFVVATANFNGGTVTDDAATPITDSTGSNIYTLISRCAVSGNTYAGLFYCSNPVVSATQTFTYNTTSAVNDFTSIAVLAWDGGSTFDTAPAWVQPANISTATNTSDTATTAQASELLVSAYGGGNGGAASSVLVNSTSAVLAATWAVDRDLSSASGEPLSIGHALVSNGPGAYGARWSDADAGPANLNIATFAAAAVTNIPPGLGPDTANMDVAMQSVQTSMMR